MKHITKKQFDSTVFTRGMRVRLTDGSVGSLEKVNFNYREITMVFRGEHGFNDFSYTDIAEIIPKGATK